MTDLISCQVLILVFCSTVPEILPLPGAAHGAINRELGKNPQDPLSAVTGVKIIGKAPPCLSSLFHLTFEGPFLQSRLLI